MPNGNSDDKIDNTAVGIVAGAILFGGVALLAAPVAVPAVVGLLGVAASPAVMTAITAGVVALSAGAGATVGYFTGNEAVPAVMHEIKGIVDIIGGIKVDDDLVARANSICEDLESANDNDFLNFLDIYREKAVLNILNQNGSLQDKSTKIFKIFSSTNYFFIPNDNCKKLGLSQDFPKRKAEIIKAIITNPDFPLMTQDDRELMKSRKGLFSQDELIKRSLIFKNAVKIIIIDFKGDETNIEKALKMLALQHSISSSSKFGNKVSEAKKGVEDLFASFADKANESINPWIIDGNLCTEEGLKGEKIQHLLFMGCENLVKVFFDKIKKLDNAEVGGDTIFLFDDHVREEDQQGKVPAPRVHDRRDYRIEYLGDESESKINREMNELEAWLRMQDADAVSRGETANGSSAPPPAKILAKPSGSSSPLEGSSR